MGESLDLPIHNILEAGLTWIRTLDAGPVLTTRDAIERGDLPSLEPGAPWPLVPQKMSEFPGAQARWEK